METFYFEPVTMRKSFGELRTNASPPPIVPVLKQCVCLRNASHMRFAVGLRGQLYRFCGPGLTLKSATVCPVCVSNGPSDAGVSSLYLSEEEHG